MNIRISELDDEQVDHLRFDRIKIQRKRMEHILEVIKDLTFKNKELIKQNMMLKEQIKEERRFKHALQDIDVESKLLVEKNLALEVELNRYKQAMLQQEMLIQHLQEELSCNNFRQAYSSCKQTYAKENYSTEPHFAKHLNQQFFGQDQFITSQDYEVLKAQYKDLQKQYSKLFQSHFSREKENQDTPGHIYSMKKDVHSRKTTEEILRKAKSHKDLEENHFNSTTSFIKLREKYEKIKRQKKQLLKSLPSLEGQIKRLELRQQNLVELVDIMKEKKTKICLCHINKLEKQLQLKANLLQNSSG